MITKKELRRIAKLARLSITKDEEERFTKELSSILNYVEKLKEADVSGVEPTSHPFGVENVMRSDKNKKFAKSKKLLELAPETKDGYLKVKSIFEIN
ncbi:MAG: Asp-tRNA(Asn)/Glu-tRNA(Gln) amidotransferase subunit GatC [Candidatus Nealsonbacteria bacterium]|nr:Asp-tRNA(Asn)/Glu-tRNA(Gln) amidotransferase subunit GatC [Candidatus Nealsonbacteria bacterium]